MRTKIVLRKFSAWLDRHRSAMPRDLLMKAEFARLTLTWTKPQEIEKHDVVRQVHEKTLRDFADAWAEHSASAVQTAD